MGIRLASRFSDGFKLECITFSSRQISSIASNWIETWIFEVKTDFVADRKFNDGETCHILPHGLATWAF